MPLPKPNLDDLRFQDIVDEAKRRIPTYCPEWTAHNVSDPGITLIELFAWMTEMLIYRLNRVPDKSYITFMELVGIRLESATAATVPLTFRLSAPATEPVKIPAGTEASTVPGSLGDAVSFHTDNELTVYVPHLIACQTSHDEREFTDQFPSLRIDDDEFLAFEPTPRQGNAFYMGFSENLSNNILALLVEARVEGIGVDPTNPPLAWEAWCGNSWDEAELESDSTYGLNKLGEVVLFLPPGMQQRAIAGHGCYWLRCRYLTPAPNQPIYSASPRIRSISASTHGGTVSATHAFTIVQELLGRSDGKPGQTFRLEHLPVLPRRPGETIEVQGEDGAWEPWEEREHFGDSLPRDIHFVLDSVSGEVAFGPAIREPDGSERQYGAIPPRGRLMRVSRYRCGGGAAGNVGAGTVTVLKTPVPYVDRVMNRRAARGGRDAESLEHAKLRTPRELRTGYRAVTAEDYEFLARSASGGVARAHCIQPRAYSDDGTLAPGTVRVVLVPTVDQPEGRLLPDQLRLTPEIIHDVEVRLDQRRLLTTMVEVVAPEYVWVKIVARLRARPEASIEGVRREALGRLYHLLNPLVGGSQGGGWEFGRHLYISEIFSTLQQTPGMAYIEEVQLFREGSEEPQTQIIVPQGGLIASAEHRVQVE